MVFIFIAAVYGLIYIILTRLLQLNVREHTSGSAHQKGTD